MSHQVCSQYSTVFGFCLLYRELFKDRPKQKDRHQPSYRTALPILSTHMGPSVPQNFLCKSQFYLPANPVRTLTSSSELFAQVTKDVKNLTVRTVKSDVCSVFLNPKQNSSCQLF